MTHSGDPWISSGMKELNAPLEAPVRAFLQNLARDPSAHARFMNMLSMLEHMGSRKIMLSQMDKVLTEDILKHLAEEARHAYFFKRQAERLAGEALDGYDNGNCTTRIPAAMYFGRMDAGISKRVAPADSYPWVSLIIELRACWLYAIYHQVLEESGLRISLKSLLAEEDMHLAEMFGMCGADTNTLRALTAYETDLFRKFWAVLEKTEGCHALAA
ncbi:MAG: hypothetical protein K9G62_07050 [Alphaproteobacteria bacterium]|nr:hypothetical protein [Alphaproteobacteria bacterium]